MQSGRSGLGGSFDLSSLDEHPENEVGNVQTNSGDLAQLGERFHGMEEVRGSSPLISTNFFKDVFFVYILQSETTGRFYVGHAQDLSVRLEEHNTGRSPATRRRGPWKLVHTEEFATRAEAMARETQIKSWKSSKAINALIAGSASR
jgi:putative endonuclease